MRQTRRQLLDAASDVAIRDGAAHLTLDAVAREAGVSKGGVLYHFPTKEALITAMLDDLTACFQDQLAASAAESDERPGRWLRSYVRASFAPAAVSADVRAALLVAIATNPDLLAPIQREFQTWQDRAASDGIDPARATIVRLAADGLWFAELFGLAPPIGEQRRQVMDRLLGLTEHVR